MIAGSVVSGADRSENRTQADNVGHEPSDYDESAGYEAPTRGLESLGLKGAANDDPGSAADAPPARDQTRTAEFPSVSGDSGSHPVFNQTMASAPQPVEEERESRDNPFGKIFGWKGSGAAPGGGGPPLARFRDLPLDQKMRIWRTRALIVVVVGVVFTVVASWQAGLSLAIIAAIVDTVYRSRTVETHHAPQAGTIDRATLRAQKRTIRQLARMERAGYLALHRRPIPDSVEVIDHLVIGPTGVYAIDSEKWNKELPIRFYNGNQLWLGPESKKERLQHAHWEAQQASERLSAKLGMEVTVQPTLAIYGPKIPWDVARIKGVDVFSGDRLQKYLRRRARNKHAPRLTDEQIQKIYEAAAGVLPLEWHNAATPVG